MKSIVHKILVISCLLIPANLLANEVDCEKASVPTKIKADCDLDAKYFGRTALLNAVKEGNRSDVEALILHKANLDIRGYYDETPLMASVTVERLDIFKLLIAAGANVNLKNNVGNDALKISQITGQRDMEVILLSKNLNQLQVCDWSYDKASEYFFISQILSEKNSSDKDLAAMKEKLQPYATESFYNDECLSADDEDSEDNSAGGSK
jgi:hypothetical protein